MSSIRLKPVVGETVNKRCMHDVFAVIVIFHFENYCFSKLLQDVIDEQEENQSDDELDKSGSEKKTAGKQSLVFILT